jgi:preprotein translocase subunit SecD
MDMIGRFTYIYTHSGIASGLGLIMVFDFLRYRMALWVAIELANAYSYLTYSVPSAVSREMRGLRDR